MKRAIQKPCGLLVLPVLLAALLAPATARAADYSCTAELPVEVALNGETDEAFTVTITAEECEGLDLCDGEPTRTPGERLAASYVNFYIANGAVVMPAFGDPMDEKAQAILQGLFPTRRVVAIPARDILIGGGNIHCITQQIPKA